MLSRPVALVPVSSRRRGPPEASQGQHEDDRVLRLHAGRSPVSYRPQHQGVVCGSRCGCPGLDWSEL